MKYCREIPRSIWRKLLTHPVRSIKDDGVDNGDDGGKGDGDDEKEEKNKEEEEEEDSEVFAGKVEEEEEEERGNNESRRQNERPLSERRRRSGERRREEALRGNQRKGILSFSSNLLSRYLRPLTALSLRLLLGIIQEL